MIFASQFSEDISAQLWISLNDFYKEGSFVWEATGELAEIYSYWGAGQPITTNLNHNCVYAGFPSAQRKWFSEDCYDSNKKKRYICEKPRDVCSD